MHSSAEISGLLAGMREGNSDCESRLLSAVYDELRQLAAGQLRNERAGHSLQPTALVNEAYLRMLGGGPAVTWENRAHFFAMAAGTMRRILIDHARKANAGKRPKPNQRVDFENALTVAGGFDNYDDERMLAIDDALVELAALDERQARVVEMRFFGGLTVKETAAVLKVAPKTVQRDWTMALAWLQSRVARPAP